MRYNESVWAWGLRVYAGVNLFIGIIVSIYTGGAGGTMISGLTGWDEPILFVIIFIAVFAMFFLSTAVIMVFLEIARDTSLTAKNTYDKAKDIAAIKKLLTEQQRFMAASAINAENPANEPVSNPGSNNANHICKKCKMLYNAVQKYCPYCFFERDALLEEDE